MQVCVEYFCCICCLLSQSCPTLLEPMDCCTPGFPVLYHFPKLAQTSCLLSQWFHPTILSSVVPFSCFQSFPASGSFPVSRLFASAGQSIGSFSISLSNEHPGLISFTRDWLDLLAVQGILLQHHSSKASIPQCSAFFIVQLSHLYITTGKTIALTRQTFVGKVIYLLLIMLCRFVIAFLSRSKCLLVSWLQSPSAVGLEPKKIKSVPVSIVSPSVCHKVMGPDAMNFVFWMLSFKSAFSLSSFSFNRRLLVPSAYLRLLSFLLIPACASSNPSILHDVLCI